MFSPSQLGELVEGGRILPLSKEALAGGELDWSDVFPVVQSGAASYGGQAYAVPFGSPALTLCYRRDLFERFDRKPPTTWAQYAAEVEFFRDRERLGELAPADDQPWHASVEPLAPGWAGRMLLARAAAYVRHRDNFSTLLSIDDLRPLIDEPPFVRALEELVASAKTSAAAVLPAGAADPTAARSALLAGQCAMAVTWPTAADAKSASAGHAGEIAFAQLPGAPQCYNFATHRWDQRKADEPIHVPLVPVAGCLGAVTKDSANAQGAFQLLFWLSGPQWGTEVAATCAATTLYRHSQTAASQKWVDAGTSAAAARQYAAVAGDALSQPVWVHGLRFAGWQQYEAALDTAVQQALAGEQTPQAALSAAAATWNEISARLGKEKQLAAYRRSLGLD